MSSNGFHELNYEHTCLMGAVRPDGFSVDVYRNQALTESVMDLDSGEVISNADQKLTTLEFDGVPHPVCSKTFPAHAVEQILRRMGWSNSQMHNCFGGRIGVDNATHRRSVHCAPMLLFEDYTQIKENQTGQYQELAYSNLMIQCWPKAFILCGQRPPDYLSTCYAQQFHEEVLRRGAYPKHSRDCMSWLQSLTMNNAEFAPVDIQLRDEGYHGQQVRMRFRDGSALTAYVEIFKDSVRLHTMNIEQSHRSAAYHYERGHSYGRSADQMREPFYPHRSGKSAFLEGRWGLDEEIRAIQRVYDNPFSVGKIKY